MWPALITIVKGVITYGPTVAPAVEAVVRQRFGRPIVTDELDIEAERAALHETWQAYEFQTRQRNLSLAMFVVTIALLVVGYAIGLAADLPVLAAVFAIAAAILVGFLNRMDAVYRARQHLTERAFRDLDDRLVALGDPSRAGLVPRTGGLSQDALLLVLQALAFWALIIAFVYAAVQAI